MREINPILRDILCQQGNNEFLLFSHKFVFEYNKTSGVVTRANGGNQSDRLLDKQAGGA